MSRNTRGWIMPRLAKYNAFWIRRFEESAIRKYGDMPPRHQPVFIVGAPRTGSTILYQVLTNVFDVLYIDNLTDLFHRNFYFGFWLSDLVFRQKAHDCYTSKLGNTFHCGLRGPSECAGFWYRWLPRDRHYIDRGEIDAASVEEMRRNIFSVINRWNRPLIFKNLNAGQRLGLLSEICPDAKFIFVKRDPLFTAQSIYQSKMKLGIKPDDWWSVKPENFMELEKLDWAGQIVKQIFYCEKAISEDLNRFDFKEVYTVNYDEIAGQYERIEKELKIFIGGELKKRNIFRELHFTKSDRFVLDDEIKKQFEKEISKFDWEIYHAQ